MGEGANGWLASLEAGEILLGMAIAILAAGIWIGKVNADRSTFKDFMKEVRGSIESLLERVPNTVAGGGSPFRLTKLGVTVSDEIDAPSWVEKLFPLLRARARDMEPYDVQALCLTFVENELAPTDNETQLMKKVAYNNAIDVDLPRFHGRLVLGVDGV